MDEKIFYTETIKPDLSDETLEHFGIKGMKWGKRKIKDVTSKIKRKLRNTKYAKARRKSKYAASHLADEIMSGRRRLTPGTKGIYERQPDFDINRRDNTVGAFTFKNKKDYSTPFTKGKWVETNVGDFEKAFASARRRRARG